MNVIDIGIILLFIMFIISGIKKGVIKESVSLIALILVFVLSFALKKIVGGIFCMIFPFLELDGFVTINILFYQLLAFVLVFMILIGIYGVSVRISKVLQKIVNMTIILILPSKILGGVVSLLKGYIVVFIVFFVLMIPLGNTELFRESKCVNFMMNKTPLLSGYTKSFVNAVYDVIDLSEKVSQKSITVNDANLKTLDIMLKYKIVEKGTVEALIEVHKLDDVADIDSVVSKY